MNNSKSMIQLECHACHQIFNIEEQGVYHCPHCQTPNLYTAIRKQESPWQTHWKTKPIVSFIETAKQILGSPSLYFRSLTIPPDYGAALLYGICCQTLGVFLSIGYQSVFSLMHPAFLATLGKKVDGELLFEGLVTPFVLGGMLIFMPLFAFLGIVFSTLINHFFLWILQGNKQGHQATFQAICYASSGSLLMVIPILGTLLGGIWHLVLTIIGLKETHEIPYWKSILCVFMPTLITCGLLVTFFMGLALLIPLLLYRTS